MRRVKSGSCEEEYATALVVVAGGGEVVLIVGVELPKDTVFRLMVSGSCRHESSFFFCLL